MSDCDAVVRWRRTTVVWKKCQDEVRTWTHVAWPLPAVSSPSTTLLRSSASTAAMAVSAAFESVKGVGTSLILMKESCPGAGDFSGSLSGILGCLEGRVICVWRDLPHRDGASVKGWGSEDSCFKTFVVHGLRRSGENKSPSATRSEREGGRDGEGWGEAVLR
jgi:hypothetical protein